jgi:O-antigen ligase
MGPPSQPRATTAAVLLIGSFLASLVFYGPAVNLLVLAIVVALLLLALVCVGSGGLKDLLAGNGAGLGLSIAIIASLIIAYRLSLSPDNSFSASWVLAAGPIAFLCFSSVGLNPASRRLVVISGLLIVVVLAMISSIRFVLFGERAHQPMVDPNHYGMLMYLVWIPLVHWHVARGWQNDLTIAPRLLHGAVLSASFLLTLSVIATHSRTSQLIVFGALAGWALMATFRRVSWRWLLAHVAVVAAAYGVEFVVATVSDVSSKGLEFGSGLSIRHELIRAALAMFAQHPLGVGIFCFPLLYPSFRSILEQETAGLFVHNDYVQLLVEGGIPLVALLLLFIGLVLRRSLRLIRLPDADPRFAALGVGIALIAACTHALVNFVFYSLSLNIFIGIIAATFFVDRLDKRIAPKEPIRIPAGAFIAGVLAAWTMWLYLVLDVAVVGVFQDQPTFGLLSSIRGDEPRMIRFSRVAQRMNGSRGIPALGEAVLLYRAARAEPESRYLRDATYRQFHRAIEVDPWNPLIYVRFSQFLDEFGQTGQRSPGESDEDLLLSAIGLDPIFVPALDQLLLHYASTSQESKRYSLLRRWIYPWMQILRRNDPGASDRYFELLEGYASAQGDGTFLAELNSRRAELADVAPKPQAYWFF